MLYSKIKAQYHRRLVVNRNVAVIANPLLQLFTRAEQFLKSFVRYHRDQILSIKHASYLRARRQAQRESPMWIDLVCQLIYRLCQLDS